MVAGGGLREDEKKADRERERVAGGARGGRHTGWQRRRRYAGGRLGGRVVGWVVGWPDDGVGDEVSRTWSRTRASECTRNEATARARRRTDPFSSD